MKRWLAKHTAGNLTVFLAEQNYALPSTVQITYARKFITREECERAIQESTYPVPFQPVEREL